MAKTKQPSLAEKFQKLEQLTEWFEGEDIDLEKALTKFEEGLTLASECKKQLTEIENKVQSMKKEFKGVLEE